MTSVLPSGILTLPLFGPSGGYAVKVPHVAILIVAWATGFAVADETLYRYEGDVHPLDPSAGWEEFNPCEPP